MRADGRAILDAAPDAGPVLYGGRPIPGRYRTEPLTNEQLNQQISETLPEVIKHAHDLGQSIATEFGLTGSDAMALFKLDAP